MDKTLKRAIKILSTSAELIMAIVGVLRAIRSIEEILPSQQEKDGD